MNVVFGLWSKFDGLCLVSHATIQESVSLNVTYSVSGVTSTVSGQSVTVIAIIVNILQLLQYTVESLELYPPGGIRISG